MASEEFKHFLEAARKDTDSTSRTTQLLIALLRGRVTLEEECLDYPGPTVETLACDLVNIVCHIEARLPREK